MTPPKEIFSPEPEYSEEARKAKFQGTCVVQLVVGPDGVPHDMRVVRTLGLGLDEKAIEAVQKWRFEPGKKDGVPVATLVNVEVQFPGSLTMPVIKLLSSTSACNPSPSDDAALRGITFVAMPTGSNAPLKE